MGRDSLILVNEKALYDKILLLLSDHRSDVPMKYHERDTEEIIEELRVPSF